MTTNGRRRTCSTARSAHVLRRLARGGELTDRHATIAFHGYMNLEISRFAADWLDARIWELRHNLAGYDATYVALAEALDAVLVTTDERLSRTPGIRCAVTIP